MANKPFEIQSSTLTIGGVDLQAGSNGVVIPGVTRAATFKVEEVDERDGANPDTFGDDEGAVTVIDNAEYLYLVNDGDVASGSYVAATYSVDELDDGQIESINVESVGVFAAADKTRVEAGNMWAIQHALGEDPLDPFVAGDWTQIPYRPKIQANLVELDSGGGGSLTVGNGTSTSIENVTEILINGTITEIEPGLVGITVDSGGDTVSYKGFKAVYARMYDSEPTISKVLIYQDSVTTTPTLEVDTDTDRDLFKVSGLANSSVIALVNIYGSDDTYPTALSTLQHFAKSIIDNVILSNGNADTNIDVYDMRSRFYDNFNDFASRAGNRYKNFEFLREEWFDISGTGGSGTGATFDLFRNVHEDLIDYANTKQRGINYQVGNVITISGASLGGTTPENNIVITVTEVGAGGEIDAITYTGILPANAWPLDNIDDGGDDQYDGANYIFTNIQGDSYIAYNDDETGESERVWAVNYNGGNVNESGAAWFGTDSEYVTTYNDSIFGLFVTGANINWIATNGNSGFDGDGIADTGSLQLVDTDGLINGNQTFVLNADGSVKFPDGSIQITAYTEGDPNVWVQDFESTTTGVPTDIVAAATSVEYLNNGDIVAVFLHYYEEGSGRYSTIGRFTPTGEKVWSMKFQGALYTDGWGLAVNNDGGYIFLAGESSGNTGYTSAVLTKLDQADGEIIWSKTYDVGYNNYNVVVDMAGNDPIVVGYASNGTDNRIVTTKIHGGTGEVLWSKALNGQGDDEAYGMAVDNNNGGDIVTVGYIAEIEVSTSHSVTPLTGSGVNVLVIDRSDLGSDTLTDTWTVAGTGITGTIGVNAINVYTGLTGTVQQGSGATFDITAGVYYTTVIVNGGTNYLVGHKIKILGSALGGVDVTNDLTITVTAVEAGAITNMNYGGTSASSTTSLNIAATVDYDTWSFNSISGMSTITNPQGTLLTELQSGIPSGAVGGAGGGQGIFTSSFADTGGGVWAASFMSNPSFPVPDGNATSGQIVWTDTTTYNALTGTNYQTGSGLEFDLELDSGSTYTEHPFIITAAGTNYVTGDVVTISGALLGGTSPANDLTTTVSTDAGGVTTFNTFTGTQQTTTYRVRTDDEGIDFSGVGTWTLNGTTVNQDDRMVVVKYDSNGAIQWQRAVQVEAGYNCIGADADIDSDGNIYVCGNFDYDDNNSGTNQAMILIKFNSSGTKKWTRKVQGPCEDFASSVVVGPDNCLYLSAFTASADNSDYSMVIAKYNLDGTVAWQRLLDSLTNWTFAGQFFFGNGGGSTIAVRDGYVAVVGGVANFNVYTVPQAIIAQFGTDGKIFTRGDYDFKEATFSGLLNTTASNITVTDAGKVSSDYAGYAGAFTPGDFEPDFDLTSDLVGTVYRNINAGNELVNGNYTASLNANGSLTLPAGGTVSEGYVTSNPTIQLTPARPDVASQKLVIKGGGIPYYIENGIEVSVNYTTRAVGETLTVTVYSDTYANQTLYWWINPEGVGISDPESGTVTLTNNSGNFSFVVDSDDYEFRVRVSPEDHNYGPGVIGAQSPLINSGAPTFNYEHHLHLTTGNLAETSIFLGTDNHNVRTTTDGGIEITTETTTVNPPDTITISGADVTGVNLVYTRDPLEVTPTWTSPVVNPATDPYIVFDGQWGIVAPDYGTTPLYVNAGTLGKPFTQWSTNPPLGSVAPTGVYTYIATDVHAWTFGTTGSLTFPDATVQTTAYIPGGSSIATGVSRSDDNLIIRLTDPNNDGLQLRSILVNGSEADVASTVLSANGFIIRTNSNVSQKEWQFGTDGSTTFPGALVKSTTAIIGTIYPTTTGTIQTLSISPSISGLTDGTYGPFTLGVATFTVLVVGGVINGITNLTATSDVTVGDNLGTIDSGDIGGIPGATPLTITVAGVVQATPTALDLNKSINSIGDGTYSLADGVEGQVMYLVPNTETIGSVDNVFVTVAHARDGASQDIDVTLNPFYYYVGMEQVFTSICTLIYTQAHWQQIGGSWGE